LVEGETIQFNRASDHWLDVEAFRTLAAAGPGSADGERSWEEAVVLYRGSFLEGFSLGDSAAFEDWTLLVRERLQRKALEALGRLVERLERRGEVGRACEVAWREVELAPWQEEAHRQLMRLLALDGRRSAALAQYEACRRLLAQELDVEPDRETTRLYERIRGGVETAFAVSTPPHNLPLPATPFVGREKQLAEV
jgi:DNA-binding SARP family transcriptional activator